MLLYFGAYVDFYAAIITLILLLIILARRDIYAFHEKILAIMIFLTFIMLIIEAITFFIDGTAGYRVLNIVLNTILFLGTSVIATIWAIFIDYKLFHSLKRLQRLLYYSYPIITTIMLLALNLMFPILFSVSQDNVFTRESGIVVSMVVLYVMFIFLLLNLIFQRKKLSNRSFGGLLALLIFPGIGGSLQMMFYGLTSLFSMFVLGLLTCYIALENIAVNRDSLTNLFTRKKVMDYLQSQHELGVQFRVVLFDMDNLKELNDSQGHHTGDQALIILAHAIRDAFLDNSMVARVGGDEFLAVVEYCDDVLLQKAITQIYNTIEQQTDIDIRFSYGSLCTKESNHQNIDELLRDVDEKMYQQKAIHKNYRRRRSD
ncbi:GGDEF domain-containing protein [Candidatus Xianfuyuplasma coldseepsis]|uniref:GGDEF domain-containing protein n=1 Tax=Candidatus Xianfuyuplasma coldseepsis TaxID=2782163 RepID=A0A7L7KNT6_9MOLU|nr:GGDEF domain-containing protein [Xianfuyuplasma coldseepsis]QMS84421.1 GGDEF domain-containing protein [Xianfuyuplasma coldseepsis]